MTIDSQAVLGWTVVLRRQPTRIVHGQHEGGYSDAYELVCCDCGDDPDLDYREISPKFQRIRGPYWFADGVAAYKNHVRRHKSRRPVRQLRDGQPGLLFIQKQQDFRGKRMYCVLCRGRT